MPDGRLVFNHTVEAMFITGIGSKMTDELRARLKAAGLDLGAPLLPAYPLDQWSALVAITAATLFPRATVEDAHHTLGEWLTDGYFQTFIGRALKPLVKLLGTRRTLARMKQNFRGGNNYTESRLDDLGATHVRLWMNEPGNNAFVTRGILTRGLQVTSPTNLIVRIDENDGASATYDISWEA